MPFIIAGDRKSPHKEIRELCKVLGDATYLDPRSRTTLYPDLSRSIGWDSIQRRNIAILEAAKLEPDVIVSIDDDNHPRGDYFNEIEAAFQPHRGYVGRGSWFNIGEFATDSYTYRGYPYRFREPVADYTVNGDGAEIGIVNGLIYGDPDINAVERQRTDPQVRSYDSEAEAGMALDPARTWSPINSQNTAWRAELAPLMLLPPRVGRYDDIWGSYIAQRVLAGSGLHVRFGKPFVEQQRNAHDLEKDLRDEQFGAAFTLQFTEALQRAELPEGTVLERLRATLNALAEEDLELPLDFFDEWLAAWE